MMKEKLTPGIILLVCTGILFIAGIFLMEIKTAQQISDYETQLDSYIQQVNAQKEKLDNASAAYADAIQSQKDLLNWKKQTSSGSHKSVDERLPESDDSDKPVSVFSQNTSPEYNSFASDETGSSNETTSEITQQDSESLFSDGPAA